MFSSHMREPITMRADVTSRTLPSSRTRPKHASASPNPYPTSYTSLTSYNAACILPLQISPQLSLGAKLCKLPSCRKYASSHPPRSSTFLQLAHFWAVSMTPSPRSLHHSCFNLPSFIHASSLLILKSTFTFTQSPRTSRYFFSAPFHFF